MLILRTTFTPLTVALTTSATTTPEVNIEGASQGTVYVPSGSSITSLTWYGAPYGSNQPAGPAAPLGLGPAAPTFLPIYDSTLAGGTALAQTVAAGHAVQIPAAVFGCAAVKVVANAGGNVQFSFKS